MPYIKRSVLILFLMGITLCSSALDYQKSIIYNPLPVILHILTMEQGEYFMDVHCVEEPYVKKLSAIVKETGAVMGINGGFFGRENNEILGLLALNGNVISRKKVFSRDSLIIGHDNSPLIEHIEPSDLTTERAKKVRAILSGGHSILKDGKVINNSSKRNPMTAVGYNREKLYFVVAEGRAINSWGMDEKSLGEFMKGLGCTHAIAMDGGGSSEVVLSEEHLSVTHNSSHLRLNGVKVLNRPSEKGQERAIKTALLLFKKQGKVCFGKKIPEYVINMVMHRVQAEGLRISLVKEDAQGIFSFFSEKDQCTYTADYGAGSIISEAVYLIDNGEKMHLPQLTYIPSSKGEPIVEVTDGLEYFNLVAYSSGVYEFNIPGDSRYIKNDHLEFLIFETLSDIINRCKEK